jgi:hypothetical protein
MKNMEEIKMEEWLKISISIVGIILAIILAWLFFKPKVIENEEPVQITCPDCLKPLVTCECEKKEQEKTMGD